MRAREWQRRQCVLWNGRGSCTEGSRVGGRRGDSSSSGTMWQDLWIPMRNRYMPWEHICLVKSHMNSGQWLPLWKGAWYSFKNSLVCLTCSVVRERENDINFNVQGKVTFPMSVEQRTSYNWNRWWARWERCSCRGQPCGWSCQVGQRLLPGRVRGWWTEDHVSKIFRFLALPFILKSKSAKDWNVLEIRTSAKSQLYLFYVTWTSCCLNLLIPVCKTGLIIPCRVLCRVTWVKPSSQHLRM